MPKKIKKSKVKVVVKKNSKNVVKKVGSASLLKISKPFNKSQIVTAIAERTSLSKKDAVNVLEVLFEVVAAHLKKRSGPGEFILPNVAKFRIISKPATKARQGINPFTGESMVFAAKPARNVIRVRALKKLKDIAM